MKERFPLGLRKYLQQKIPCTYRGIFLLDTRGVTLPVLPLILQKKLIRSPSNKAAEVNGGIPKVKISGSLPIQAPVLNRFGQVLLTDVFGSVQVGNRAGNLEDAGVGAGGETEPVGDHFQEAVA